MTDTCLANATLVLPHQTLRGALHLSEGRIIAIEPGSSLPKGAVDCNGDLVLPGLIELHTDNLERHIEPRPKVHWPRRAAIMAHDGELAACGITTVFDALRLGSASDPETSFGEYARALAHDIQALRQTDALRINHFIHLRAEICSDTLEAELAKFGPEDGIGIVSLMDHTPGQRQFRDLSLLRAYAMGKRGLTEAQFHAQIEAQKALGERVRTRHESAAVAASRRYGAVLASHDDTTADQVAASHAHGARIAEFPTTVEAARACRDTGIAVMMGAPNLIRGGSHSGNVAAHALAEAGLLDILSSDYVPSALLSGALVLGDLWGDLPRGVATVTSVPAAAAGLADRGQLAVGLRADVIRVARLDTAAAVRGVWVGGCRVG